MFGVIDRLLLRPPSGIEDADQVRKLFKNVRWFGRPRAVSSFPYADIQDFEACQSFDLRAAYSRRELSLGSGEEATRIYATLATASFFPLLGVKPVLGRLYDEDDDLAGANGVAVLGFDFWRSHFGGTSGVLGRSLTIGNGTYTVVGVAPRGFTGAEVAPVDLWLPLHAAAHEVTSPGWATSRTRWWLTPIVRLGQGVSVEVAEAEATAIHLGARAESELNDENTTITAASLKPARAPNAPDETVVSYWLAGVSLIVLMIACANVANLMLARGMRRRREIAIHLALGVSRARLVSQLLTESILLAGLGGIAGVLLAQWSADLIRTTLLPDMYWAESIVDPRVLLFTLIASVATGLIAGVVPATQTSRADLTEALRDGGQGATSRRSKTRLAFLLAQGTLSLALLVGAGLFVRSLGRAQSLDLGLNPDGVFLGALEFRQTEAETNAATDIYMRSVKRLNTMPTVESATASVGLLFDSFVLEHLSVPGLDSLPISDDEAFGHGVTADYFATLQIPILRGRGFTSADVLNAPRVTVINESMARALWPDGDAIGKCLKIGSDDPPCANVLGVARDARERKLVGETSMQYYVPIEQRILEYEPDAFLVRAKDGVTMPLGAIRRAVLGVDPSIRSVTLRPLTDLIDPEMRSWKLGATMFTVFGALALIITTVGLYSLLAFDVAQRSHELGIRSALGASSDKIVTMVFRQAIGLMAVAIALGVTISLAAGRAVEPMLFQTSPRDPLVLAFVTVTLLFVAGLASSIPAWRAAKVDPVEVLRSE
jgi:predicted permease